MGSNPAWSFSGSMLLVATPVPPPLLVELPVSRLMDQQVPVIMDAGPGGGGRRVRDAALLVERRFKEGEP